MAEYIERDELIKGVLKTTPLELQHYVLPPPMWCLWSDAGIADI